MKSEAFSLLLGSVPWNLFGTLTTREVVSEGTLLLNAQRWLRWVAHVSGVKFRRLVYVVRLERGEAGQRLHLHVLIDVPETKLTYFLVRSPYVCRAHREWGMGMTRFRRVQQEDSAVSYVLKDISGGADRYEIGKTGKARHLVVSKGLWRLARPTSKGPTGTADRMNLSQYHTDGVPQSGLRGCETVALP